MSLLLIIINYYYSWPGPGPGPAPRAGPSLRAPSADAPPGPSDGWPCDDGAGCGATGYLSRSFASC